MTNRMGIYTRISLDRLGESASPERQEADCRNLAEQRGWTISELYADRDTSAFKRGVRRPAYDRLLRDLRDGVIDGVIVWKLDRLTRQGLTGVGPVLELAQSRGVLLASVTESIDTSTPMGRAMVGVLASVAEQESENTSLRVRAAQASAAKNGRMHSGGSRQYGLTTTGEIVPEEAEVIRECVGRVLAGESLRKIAADLNARGVRTTTAGTVRKKRGDTDETYVLKGEWRSVTLGKMLRSPRLAGMRIYGGDVVSGQWTPIITREEHEQLLAALSRPLTQRRDEARSHLLSGAGVIRCGLCESPMRRMSFRMRNGKMFDRYQCLDQPGQTQCGRTAITQASTDEFVTGELLRFLSIYKLLPLDGDANEDDLEAQLAEAKSALSDLVRERFVKRTIGAADFDTARSDIDTEISTIESQLTAARQRRAERSLKMPLGDYPALQAWWADASPEERIAAIRQSIAEVKIHKAKQRGGNKFDSDRVKIGWRWDIFLRGTD